MKKIILIFIFMVNFIIAQNISFEILPHGLHFMPLKSNMQESRLGILYFPENANLKVDIGNNVDIIGFNYKKSRLTFGMEFMAYALSTNYQGRRLQIDAVDGFFGGNGILSIHTDFDQIFFRFRIIHNSAHFVDGHFDFEKNIWKKNVAPIPFTQDFGEITFALQRDYKKINFRGNTSLGYSSLVRPALIKKWWGNAGIELSYLISDNKDYKINLFLSSQVKIAGMPKYKLNYNNLLGLKFGDWNGKGVVFYLDHYFGNNYFSEYYYRRIEKFGIGFFVDFI